jgi:hypothetical protein
MTFPSTVPGAGENRHPKGMSALERGQIANGTLAAFDSSLLEK